jgi:hypothetical protein
MSVGAEVKRLWCTCGKAACRGCGIVILSMGIAAGGVVHGIHPAVLTPGSGESPHTENHMDTHQVREPPNVSVSTASTTVFHTELPHNR